MLGACSGSHICAATHAHQPASVIPWLVVGTFLYSVVNRP